MLPKSLDFYEKKAIEAVDQKVNDCKGFYRLSNHSIEHFTWIVTVSATDHNLKITKNVFTFDNLTIFMKADKCVLYIKLA